MKVEIGQYWRIDGVVYLITDVDLNPNLDPRFFPIHGKANVHDSSCGFELGEFEHAELVNGFDVE